MLQALFKALNIHLEASNYACLSEMPGKDSRYRSVNIAINTTAVSLRITKESASINALDKQPITYF